MSAGPAVKRSNQQSSKLAPVEDEDIFDNPLPTAKDPSNRYSSRPMDRPAKVLLPVLSSALCLSVVESSVVALFSLEEG